MQISDSGIEIAAAERHAQARARCPEFLERTETDSYGLHSPEN
jgi:hypothetical protein